MNRVSSFEQIVVVDRMMVSDISELCLAGSDKLEDYPIGSIHSKAPHFVMLGVQLFRVEGWVKRVALEQIRFGSGFSLNGCWQVVKQAIKRRGRRNLDHARLFDQFAQGLPFRDTTGPMIPLRGVQGVEKFRSVQSDRVTEGFKVVLRDLNREVFACSLGNPGGKRDCHGLDPLSSFLSSTQLRRKSQMTLSNAET
jgi:hypothetical protein